MSVPMDNRSDLLNTTINITSDGTSDSLSIEYGDTSESFNGELQGSYLIEDVFTYLDTEYTEYDLSFSDVGTKQIYYNMTQYPNTISFQLWGSDIDVGNDFDFTDYFENSTYIRNESSTGDYPLWMWDDFTTDSRTYFQTTGTGTYTSEVNNETERYEGQTRASINNWDACNADFDEENSNVKVSFLAQDLGQYKEIEFYGYTYTSANANDADSCIGNAAYGYAYSRLVLTTSPTLDSYIQLPGSYVSSVVGGDDSSTSSVSATYTLKRVENTGDNFRFDVYKDDVYQGRTATLSGDINLGYYGSARARAKYGTGSGVSRGYIDTVKYSGISSNYTANLTYVTNSTFESELLETTANNITATTLTSDSRIPSTCTIDYFLSNDNGSTWEQTYTGARHVFTSTGNELKWKADLNCSDGTDTASIYEMKIEIIPMSVSDIVVACSSDSWSYNNSLNSSVSPQNVTLNISGEGTKNEDYPISFTTTSAGVITINNSVFNSSMNPVLLDKEELETCNNCQINFLFNGDNITVSDLRFDYLGGNKTYTVLAHDDAYTINTSYDITYYYSKWNYSLPSNIDGIYFYPYSLTADEVEPFGQTASIPILNITGEAYDSPGINWSILLNESHSCVNLTHQPNSTKVNTNYAENNTWISMEENLAEDGNFGVWMWADLNCNYDGWKVWQPEWYFRACASGVDVCSEELT
jgi:hypothetical protein